MFNSNKNNKKNVLSSPGQVDNGTQPITQEDLNSQNQYISNESVYNESNVLNTKYNLALTELDQFKRINKIHVFYSQRNENM